jgi:2-oxoglutarate ferredoxin oxidoreductase subunit alpha
VEDCFYTAIEAVNIARKYNVPVIILSDQAIATRIEAFAEPDLEHVCQDITPQLGTVADYIPYDLDTPDGVSAAQGGRDADFERQISRGERTGTR